MYDAVGQFYASIPTSAAMVAGYDTDHTPQQSIIWTPTMWAAFPNAVHVHICGDGTNTGDVLDMESGAASVNQLVPWLLARRGATGVWKSAYYSLSVDGDVQRALAQAGIDSALIPKWVAWYNGNASLDDVSSVVGVVAKQYADQALIPGQPPYDMSIVADFWPGIDTQGVTMGGQFRPGTHELHTVSLAEDQSINHNWLNLDTGSNGGEDLGGKGFGDPIGTWSDDGKRYAVVVSTGDHRLAINVYNGETDPQTQQPYGWSGWNPYNFGSFPIPGPQGPPGPAGPPGPPGPSTPSAPFDATVTPKV